MTHDRNHSGSRRGAGGPRRVDRGRGYKRVSTQHVEVYDLDLAAWLHVHNTPVVNAAKHGREMVIVFLDPEDRNVIDSLAVSYLNSEAARFASAVRQLKKVTLSTQRQQRERR